MASSYLFSFFLLNTLLLISMNVAAAGVPESEAPFKPQKVNLSLYYECLCPFCENFIVNQLVKVFNTDLSSIVNLRFVPWGNARLSDSKEPICQHGEAECYLNKVEACAIKAWPKKKQHFEFIQCVERQDSKSEDPEKAWKTCSDAPEFNPESIRSCLDSGEGLKLLLKYGNETASLNPPHQYVPWVTVNGEPLREDYPNFVSHVCDKYDGTSKPKACQRDSEASTNEKEKMSTASVCYPAK